jgi:hypothetical protein
VQCLGHRYRAESEGVVVGEDPGHCCRNVAASSAAVFSEPEENCGCLLSVVKLT